MTLVVERKVAACLRDIRPRDRYAAELLAALTGEPARLHSLAAHAERSRTPWLVAGAVAGVVSATGVVYLAARRHRGAA
jgi:hypothetical protein